MIVFLNYVLVRSLPIDRLMRRDFQDFFLRVWVFFLNIHLLIILLYIFVKVPFNIIIIIIQYFIEFV